VRFSLPVGKWFGKRKSASHRIVFFDSTLAYTPETPYREPLGGSQYAVCYLAEALAAVGHEAILLNPTTRACIARGVSCLPLDTTSDRELRRLRPDAVVEVLSARHARGLRESFGPEPRLIVWTGHAHDQPAVEPLREPAQRELYDAVMLVSEWQRECFIEDLGVERSRTHVIPYAVAPAFQDLFGRDESITSQKATPPVIAYTSTPFRGLAVLLDVFPEIRRRVPGTRLKVFSSMRVYRTAAGEEERDYAALYRRCTQIEGVEYIGSLPQPELARELREVTALAYPNTFPETFCIAALEAMAAGCRVVTSELGALADTTAGYARLVAIVGRQASYAADFIEATVATLNDAVAGADEALLRAQVDHANGACTWEARAGDWTAWLNTIVR
jgi:glycosyltransferase involved in cell wall biosynthesis